MWTCAIDSCGRETGGPEDLLVHQARDHEQHQCAVCGTVLPDGYFAIRHAFTEHSRAQYVRAYEADADDIRHREKVIEAVESNADVERVVSRLNGNAPEEF